MRFRVGFINCQNLYSPGENVGRSRAGEAAVAAKIASLAATIRRSTSGPAPDVVGLCEVGSRAVGERVGRAIGRKSYEVVWEHPPVGPPGEPEVGIMILYDPKVFRHLGIPRSEPVYNEPRYHWFAAELQLRRGSGRSLWVVMNHWASDFGRGPYAARHRRLLSAQSVGEFCEQDARQTADAMLLMGDFNCEPHEDPLTGESGTGRVRIRGVREHDWAMNEENELPYFYNPLWRRLGEPVPLEQAIQSGHNRFAQPPGTYCKDRERQRFGWITWDQLLVNKRLMVGGPARLLEKTIRVSRPPPGVSDHCAVGVEFAYD